MTNPPSSQFEPAPIPDGRVIANGNTYMTDAKGGLIPVDLVKAQDQLQDETVRKIIGHALALSGQTTRFKAHTFEDIGDFEAILEQEYGGKIGGKRGNKTLMSFDGLFRIQVAVADQIDFGPELQIAKGILDELMTEWAANARPEVQAIITNAFNTDKEGQINRAEIFKLLRLDIEDERWQCAMRAIRDAIRVIGQATYVRCYQRPAPDARWQHITIDLAKA
ncbi:DUF3164 family protein [Parasedimentitalea psychrophila]|uniref:DUF3164 family protein n=1 Tax=Parasedimentitalea psychrophila TaxID=2997337 RepID=A0A9Y2P6I5_9RHOB|nr:DUF3164 family protein [Parasedimentitalea psychrophila]WIY25038.1 DUF3164 family protein [Parasedimentitalea psychrophila]